jgi:hypothetical protein
MGRYQYHPILFIHDWRSCIIIVKRVRNQVPEVAGVRAWWNFVRTHMEKGKYHDRKSSRGIRAAVGTGAVTS